METLPQECLDRLAETYLFDRAYDFSTFVKTTEVPIGGYFAIFMIMPEYNHFLGFTTDLRGFCCPSNDFSYEVYYIPDRGIDETFYFKNAATKKSVLYTTIRILPDNNKYVEVVSMVTIRKYTREFGKRMGVSGTNHTKESVTCYVSQHLNADKKLNSLFDLASEKVLLTLSRDAVYKLLREDKYYDFSTYVRVKQRPEQGLFFVFTIHNDTTEFMYITGPLDYLHLPYSKRDTQYVVYWIPDTGLNETIYTYDTIVSRNSKIIATIRNNTDLILIDHWSKQDVISHNKLKCRNTSHIVITCYVPKDISHNP